MPGLALWPPRPQQDTEGRQQRSLAGLPGGRGGTPAHCPGLPQLPVTLRLACVAGVIWPGLAWEGTAGTGAVGPHLPATPSPWWITLWAQRQVGPRRARGPGATHTHTHPGGARTPPRPRPTGPARGSSHRNQGPRPVGQAPCPSHLQDTSRSLKPTCWARGARQPGCTASLCPPPRPPAFASGTTWASRSISVSGAGPAATGAGSSEGGWGQPCPTGLGT